MTLRSGAATFIGASLAPNAQLGSDAVGFDVNPEADRTGATSLRIMCGIGKSGFYTITLATGAASFVGAIGIGGQPPMSRIPKTRKNLLKVHI